MHKDSDLRIIKTQMALKQGLFNLLKKERIHKIKY